MIVEVRALHPEDDRSRFRSGDQALDLYFQRFAGQNQFRHHIGVTYVATVDKVILGFATVSPGSLEAERLPSGRKMPPYPLPVLRVARLAVDERAQGQGVGSLLLRHYIELAERMRDELGCVGLVVDAKADAVEFYLKLGFHQLALLEGASPQRPMPAPMFLPLGAVPRKRLPPE